MPLAATDIGLAVGNHNISDNERLMLLQSKWKPPDGFIWPHTVRTSQGKTTKRFLGPQHFQGMYECFSYSLVNRGIYCKVCALFGPEMAGGVKLDRLVKTPLQTYSHLTGEDGYLSNHVTKEFHENCVTKAQSFIDTMTAGGKGDIAQQLGSAAAAEREKNRAALKRIILAVEFNGRLGLPLRGHRDSGTLQHPAVHKQVSGVTHLSGIDYSQGNLRATLQLMLECNDVVLTQHLSTARQNSTYISPLSQNAIIDAVATVIKRSIVASVEKAQFFSILADETTDFARSEQLTVCFRYVLDFAVYERFFCFALAPDLTGKGLASQLLDIIDTAGLNKLNMIGQGFDGAAAMSGQHNGVQKHISAECPSSLYVHCVSHSLNLCLAKAAEVPEIRVAVTVMHEIAVFYSDSNKRLLNLQEEIDKHCPASNRSRLKKHCATRWVEKQEAVQVFRELYPAVVSSLEIVSRWPGEVAIKPRHSAELLTVVSSWLKKFFKQFYRSGSCMIFMVTFCSWQQ